LKDILPIVFVSSTIIDLPSERKASQRAIKKIPAIPSMSEITFEAQNKDSITLCVNKVEECDIYILILGGRFGWEIKDGISITKLEYETAKKNKKPIFVFNLIYVTKDKKQEEFVKEVGDELFYKVVNDAFELESEIEKSIRLYLENEIKIKKTNTEKVYSNLLEISFPKTLYTGELNIDRDEVIRITRESGTFIKKNVDQRKIIFEALKQQNLKFGSDWVTFNNKLITFYDLNDSEIPLSSLTDQGTVELLECEEFYQFNEDYLKVFKNLLQKNLQQLLWKIKIEWKHEDGIFVFMPLNKTLEKREEHWKSKVKATRTVFEAKMKKTKKNEISFCKHLAFGTRFYFFEDKWYIVLTPEWYISHDGKNKSRFADDHITYYKQNEHNNQVFNHTKFLINKLINIKDTDNLFTKENKNNFLEFHKLIYFNSYPKINDNSWLVKENKTKLNNIKKDEVNVQLDLNIQ
jgi:hypothetical protein